MAIPRHAQPIDEKECLICGTRSRLISTTLGVCGECVRNRPESLPLLQAAHAQSRSRYGLPIAPPKVPDGLKCTLCANECAMGIGAKGYCGLQENVAGMLCSSVDRERGLLYAYLDPHVTNCCAAWFCPAGTGSGYPRYAYQPVPETGYNNLAVFFYGCNFDCLFCQNASHKDISQGSVVTATDLVQKVRARGRISCICYFGGSPEPQLPFAITTSRRMVEEVPKPFRICFEWNGCGNPHLVMEAATLALESGGNVKFDLKCWDPSLSVALSGVSNERAYSNFQMIARELYGERVEVPLLMATTLLVPGYVDRDEVESIASFIADLDPAIPYSLLVFHPHFLMADLPVTPKRQIIGCYEAARKHLSKVHVGNLHLVGVRTITDLQE